jgi:2-polyprenyl-3-methyl-5-hydroxy-6-metoxy-1,4-benzoquinol methylase
MNRLEYKLRIWTGKSLRLALRQIFQFDAWHVFTLTERKYARDIIAFCNNKKWRRSFVEIGCGLGDIIRNVRYENKFGYDNDKKVLNAAAFLDRFSKGVSTNFSQFQFPDTVLERKHDVIVMVNWVHHIPSSLLKSKIQQYIRDNLLDEGLIIIDTVQDKDYKYNHDIEFLADGIGATYTRLGDYERMREIWILQKESR